MQMSLSKNTVNNAAHIMIFGMQYLKDNNNWDDTLHMHAVIFSLFWQPVCAITRQLQLPSNRFIKTITHFFFYQQ
jgi:hypothetical protein